jgi:hypothetical protein
MFVTGFKSAVVDFISVEVKNENWPQKKPKSDSFRNVFTCGSGLTKGKNTIKGSTGQLYNVLGKSPHSFTNPN